MIWQSVRSGFIKNTPIAGQRLGFFLRSCTSLPQPTKVSPKDTLLLRNPEVLVENPDIRRAVKKALPSLVEVSLPWSDGGSNKCCGIIVDSDGTILTSASALFFRTEVSLSNLKVDVHPHSRYVTRTFSGVFSLIDFIHDIAIVKCKSDNPLRAVKLANPPLDGDKIVSFYTDSMEYKKFPFRFIVEPTEVIASPLRFRFFSESYNPGGPLVNYNGELVGLTKYISALSVELICQMMKFAKKYEGPGTPWLGMELKFIIGKGHPFSGGWLVCEVASGSPAQHAGIYASDIIMEFDGKKFCVFSQLCAFLYFKLEEDLVVTLERLGVNHSMKVTLSPSAEIVYRHAVAIPMHI